MNRRTALLVERLTNNKIETIEQVRSFISGCFHELNLNFHPDTPFSEYAKDGNDCFDSMEVRALEKAIDQCFEICSKANVDIYAISLNEQNKKRNIRTRFKGGM